jgi:hypothetical protein
MPAALFKVVHLSLRLRWSLGVAKAILITEGQAMDRQMCALIGNYGAKPRTFSSKRAPV